MASILDVFTFESNELRVVGTPEEPLFAAVDICRPLNLDPSVAVNGRMRTRKDAEGDTIQYFEPGLDDDERSLATVMTPGGMQNMLVVTEPGLYKLIFKSKTDIAKRFQRWVTHEVLPAIRKTGFYGLPKTKEDPIKVLVMQSLKELTEMGNKPSSLDYIRLYEWHESRVKRAELEAEEGSDKHLAQLIEHVYNRQRRPVSASEIISGVNWFHNKKNKGLWNAESIRSLFKRLELAGYGITIGDGKSMRYEPTPRNQQLRLISG